MRPLAPIVVFFQDLLGEQALVAYPLELAHDHAPRGAAFAGFCQALGEIPYRVLELLFFGHTVILTQGD